MPEEDLVGPDSSAGIGTKVKRRFAWILAMDRKHFSGLADKLKCRFVAIFVLSLLLVAVHTQPVLDEHQKIQQLASKQIAAALQRATMAVGSILILDGIVSVLQSAEFGFTIGVAASMQPGQLLDPLNDVLEFIIKIMFLAMASLGIQKLLLLAGEGMSLSWSIGIPALLWLLTVMSRRFLPLFKIALIMLLPTIIMPATLIMSTTASQYIAGEQHEASHKELQKYDWDKMESVLKRDSFVSEEDGSKSFVERGDDTLWDRITTGTKKIINTLKPSNMMAKAEDAVDGVKAISVAILASLTKLLIIFFFDSLVFPLLFFVLFYRYWKWIWE